MKKKRFNDFQTPKHYMTYMSRLEDARRATVTSDDHYVLQNADLIRQYKRSRSEAGRSKIRETLFWVNMKYLHEIFMKKLNPNLYRHDVLDIYQELCISLIDGIDKALSMKDLDTKTLSGRIWSRLMTGVNRVMKEYYDQGNHYLELPDRAVSAGVWL